ncbi:NAD-dependent epimerase/dehydratase family protein, partial [Bacteroidota bacterium]
MQNKKIYLAGYSGMVGSAIHRKLSRSGHENIIARDIEDINFTRQSDVEEDFKTTKPDYVIVAAAKVGGILANDTYRAQFIYEN